MKHITLQGLGAIAQSSYLPALYEKFNVTSVEINAGTVERVQRQYPNMRIANHLQDVPEKDLLIIATPPKAHLLGMQEALSLGFNQIVCEKPATSEEEELNVLSQMLQRSEREGKILLGDHWLGRLLTWQTLFSSFKHSELKKISGFLIEPSTTEAGIPFPLDFQTGQPDRRQWIHQHPNGVLLDTAIHPLNLMLAICDQIYSQEKPNTLTIEKTNLLDRYKNPIRTGDFETAEGTATLKGTINNDVPFEVQVSKYGGEQDKKGVELEFQDGTRIEILKTQNGQGDDVVRQLPNGTIETHQITQSLYQRWIALFTAENSIFQNNKLLQQINENHLTVLKTLFGIHRSIRG